MMKLSLNGHNKWHNEILIKFCLLVFHDLLDVRKIAIVFARKLSALLNLCRWQEVTRMSLSYIN